MKKIQRKNEKNEKKNCVYFFEKLVKIKNVIKNQFIYSQVRTQKNKKNETNPQKNNQRINGSRG